MGEVTNWLSGSELAGHLLLFEPTILQACHESGDEYDTGLQLDFNGFLQLMWIHRQALVDVRVRKEQRVFCELDLKTSSINEFREIFVTEDQESGFQFLLMY